MTRRVSSYRLSEHTLAQIAALATNMGSDANVITIAVDRLHKEFLATSMDANICTNGRSGYLSELINETRDNE